MKLLEKKAVFINLQTKNFFMLGIKDFVINLKAGNKLKEFEF
jgi:hypothetical protein